MSGVERRNQRRIDELILGSSGAELERIQAIDLDTQLSGDSFYDSYCERMRGARPARAVQRKGSK